MRDRKRQLPSFLRARYVPTGTTFPSHYYSYTGGEPKKRRVINTKVLPSVPSVNLASGSRSRRLTGQLSSPILPPLPADPSFLLPHPRISVSFSSFGLELPSGTQKYAGCLGCWLILFFGIIWSAPGMAYFFGTVCRDIEKLHS